MRRSASDFWQRAANASLNAAEGNYLFGFACEARWASSAARKRAALL